MARVAQQIHIMAPTLQLPPDSQIRNGHVIACKPHPQREVLVCKIDCCLQAAAGDDGWRIVQPLIHLRKPVQSLKAAAAVGFTKVLAIRELLAPLRTLLACVADRASAP